MGGWGSTRWHSHRKKVTVEDCFVIEAQAVARHGRCTVWTVERTREGMLRLLPIDMMLGSFGDESFVRVSQDESMQWISMHSTPLPWGGKLRWWFGCPVCQRRCAKLYVPPGSVDVQCRVCYDLTYRSCQQSHTSAEAQSASRRRQGARQMGLSLAEYEALLAHVRRGKAPSGTAGRASWR